MTPNEKPAFANFIGLVFTYYQRELDGDVIDLYFSLLEEFPLADVAMAVKCHLKDPSPAGQFFPKVGDIIRHIQGSNGSRALAAWDVARKACETVPGGPYQTVTFSDRLILAVIDRMGGWPKFYYTTDKDLPFVQKEFCERYATYLGQTPKRIPSSLPGICEDVNRGGKYADDPRALPSADPYPADGPGRPVIPAAEEPRPLPEGRKAPRAIEGFGGIGEALPATRRDFLSAADAEAERQQQKDRLAALFGESSGTDR